jgi:hypothetical protein
MRPAKNLPHPGIVMPGLDPGIHALVPPASKTWMAGSSPAMTGRWSNRSCRGAPAACGVGHLAATCSCAAHRLRLKLQEIYRRLALTLRLRPRLRTARPHRSSLRAAGSSRRFDPDATGLTTPMWQNCRRQPPWPHAAQSARASDGRRPRGRMWRGCSGSAVDSRFAFLLTLARGFAIMLRRMHETFEPRYAARSQTKR